MITADIPSLQQIMLLCRPGFENECAAEIMQHSSAEGFPAYANARPGNGYVHLASADRHELTPLLTLIEFEDLVFARQWFACTRQITALPDRSRAAPLAEIASKIAEHLGNGFCDVDLGYADTNQGKTLSRFCRSFNPHIRDALKKQRLWAPDSRVRLHIFFSDSSSAWLGISRIDNSAANPMGIPRLRMPASAPSRSTLKLDEAINVFLSANEQKHWFKPGMRAVDLGAAPGGWSWQLVNRGLLVTAVDNGSMDPALLDSGMVEHLRTDAFTYSPDRKVQWLVCDMAERPLHVCRLVARWFAARNCKAAIFNLKLPMKKRYQTVMDSKRYLHQSLDKAGIHHHLQIKHLYHDREEVTACILGVE